MVRRALLFLSAGAAARTARSCPHSLLTDSAWLSWALATSHRRIAVAQVNTMKLVLALAVGASAFGGFGKKSAAPAPSRGGGNQVAQGGQTVTNIQVPKIFTTAFGDPGRLAERAARAEAKKAEAEAQLIPTPARFAFAFGRQTSSPNAAPSGSPSGSGATSSSPRRARTRATTARATSTTTVSQCWSAPRSRRAARST